MGEVARITPRRCYEKVQQSGRSSWYLLGGSALRSSILTRLEVTAPSARGKPRSGLVAARAPKQRVDTSEWIWPLERVLHELMLPCRTPSSRDTLEPGTET
jgi:hypothetical protein